MMKFLLYILFVLGFCSLFSCRTVKIQKEITRDTTVTVDTVVVTDTILVSVPNDTVKIETVSFDTVRTSQKQIRIRPYTVRLDTNLIFKNFTAGLKLAVKIPENKINLDYREISHKPLRIFDLDSLFNTDFLINSRQTTTVTEELTLWDRLGYIGIGIFLGLIIGIIIKR